MFHVKHRQRLRITKDPRIAIGRHARRDDLIPRGTKGVPQPLGHGAIQFGFEIIEQPDDRLTSMSTMDALGGQLQQRDYDLGLSARKAASPLPRLDTKVGARWAGQGIAARRLLIGQ